MPFRRAYWGVALLAPIILLAFWRDYFGVLGTASFAFHAHGLTATAWLALVGFQGVSAQLGDRRLHRLTGRAVFAAVPLFAGAAVLVMHSMAVKFAAGSHPFYSIFGARLGLHDLVSTVALTGFVAAALAFRRRIVVHAACMLATVLLVLPPVIARLPLPRVWHLGELVVIVLAPMVIWREPRGRAPFLVLIAIQLLHILLFETVGGSSAWEAAFVAFSHAPVAPFAAGAAVVALGALLLAWKQGGVGAPLRSPEKGALSTA